MLPNPLNLQAWQERYPNLRQIGEEQRRGRRLEQVLQVLDVAHLLSARLD